MTPKERADLGAELARRYQVVIVDGGRKAEAATAEAEKRLQVAQADLARIAAHIPRAPSLAAPRGCSRLKAPHGPPPPPTPANWMIYRFLGGPTAPVGHMIHGGRTKASVV